jgi:phosphatidylglycerophosphate synthase
VENLKNNIGAFFHRIGISANFVTGVGLVTAFCAGSFISKGFFFLGGILCLLAGVLDLLDGAIARASGNPKKFGAVLDSSLDRYGDGFIFGGILFYCAINGRTLYAGLALSALLGAFLVSYVRARAECLVEKCRVGFWERGERIAFVSLGLIFGNLTIVLWVLGILVHWTVFMRLYYAHRRLSVSAEADLGGGALLSPHVRKGAVYFTKILILLLLLIFVQPRF